VALSKLDRRKIAMAGRDHSMEFAMDAPMT
jgi:hypothetical protein